MAFFEFTRSKVDRFRRGRQRQTDDEFWLQCGLPDTPRAKQIALAVRRAVANVGLVDSQFIQPEDRHPGTLEVLPIWDSMDWVAFQMELERELAEPVDDDVLNMVSKGRSVTVREMAERMYAILCDAPEDSPPQQS